MAYMKVAWKSLLASAALIGLFTFVQAAAAQVTSAVSDQAVVTALKAGNLDRAESEAKKQLRLVSSSPIAATEKRRAQTALATVLAARAWEADTRYRSKRITGSDVIFLIVIVLLAGSILALLLRYGPQRPKVIDSTVQWMAKVKRENRDDGFRQAGAALFSLLLLGLIALALFVGLSMTMRIVADLDSRALNNPQAKKYFDEAKQLMEEARSPDNSAPRYQDYDVLSLYSAFLHNAGNDKLSNAVAMRAISLRNTCGRVNLKERPQERALTR